MSRVALSLVFDISKCICSFSGMLLAPSCAQYVNKEEAFLSLTNAANTLDIRHTSSLDLVNKVSSGIPVRH